MAITFGGLATGLDTGSIISKLMEIEREPLNRLESEKQYLASRLEAFSKFDEKLDALATALSDMDGPDKLGSYAARSGSEDYFSLSIENSSDASKGDFQLEVLNLAQVQKDVSNGYSDANEGMFSNGTINIDGTVIGMDADSSLNDIRDAINQADRDSETGVTASTIFDGSNYRLVLTGKDADTEFTALVSGLSAEGQQLNFLNTQAAEQAEVVLDGITITSGSNRIVNAIPGISIDLLKENVAGESTTISVESDFTEITAKLETFAAAYNDITGFIKEQDGADWGHDQSFRTVSRSLRNLLVTQSGDTGNYTHLIDIGFKTDSKTGVISVDSAKLQNALNDDYDGVEELLIGGNETTGILNQFTTYLDDWTDTLDGLYAGKKQSYDTAIRSIDSSIERMELRLEQREKTLLNQFTAMEELVNTMNATSSYLAQQMASMPSIGDSDG